MNSAAATAGLALYQVLGEPRVSWHAVARYGSLMQRIEHRLYADCRANGFGFTMTGVGIAIPSACPSACALLLLAIERGVQLASRRRRR